MTDKELADQLHKAIAEFNRLGSIADEMGMQVRVQPMAHCNHRTGSEIDILALQVRQFIS